MITFLVALFAFRTIPRRLSLSRFVPSEVRAELRAIYNADLIVCVGGGHLNAAKGLRGDLNIFYLTLPMLLAKRLRKPVVHGPQSYGPFWGKLQTSLVRKALCYALVVMVREEISFQILHELGIDPAKLLLTVDAGFDFTTDQKIDVRKMFGFGKSSKVVAITMRTWFSGEKRIALEKSFAKFIDFMHSKKYEVVLVPQVTTDYGSDDDRIAEARIASYCRSKKPALVTDAAEAGALKALYSDVDFVVGTRFHSVIFALTSSVPCMAIEYDHKTSGIMRSLGLSEWVLSLNDVTAKELIRLFKALEIQNASYKQKIHKVVPPKMKEAKLIVTKMRLVFDHVPAV